MIEVFSLDNVNLEDLSKNLTKLEDSGKEIVSVVPNKTVYGERTGYTVTIRKNKNN